MVHSLHEPQERGGKNPFWNGLGAMKYPMCASTTRKNELPSGGRSFDDVVEIGLLLPTRRAEALMALSQERRESVGQILRSLIERELAGRD
ncbi:hypothetical protein BH23PLA1_BH23PLA1_32870 [soil metagenome]